MREKHWGFCEWRFFQRSSSMFFGFLLNSIPMLNGIVQSIHEMLFIFQSFFFWFIQFRYHSSTLPIFSSFCLDLLFSRCGYDKAKHIIHKIFLCDSHADDCWIFDRNPNQKKTSQIIHSALVFYSVVAPLFSRSSAKFIIQNLASKIIYCFSVGTKHHTT